MKKNLLVLALIALCGSLIGQEFPNTFWSDYADDNWYNETSMTFEIGSAEELSGLASLVNAGNNFSGKTISLSQDIDLGQHLWTSIGQIVATPFSGVFEGDGFEILNLKINDAETDMVGLFGHCENTTINDVTINNAKVIGKDTVGSLVANLSTGSLVENCHAINVDIAGDGIVGGLVGGLLTDSNILKSSAKGIVYGVQQVGGLVGTAWNLSEIRESYSIGSVSGGNIVGGLVGFCTMSFAPNTQNVVKNCYSRASVSASGADAGSLYGMPEQNGEIHNSYGTGLVTANNNAGGLIGRMQQGIVSYSYFDTETTGQTVACGELIIPTGVSIEGKTTAEMKTQAMVDLLNSNQENIWELNPDMNNGYPVLVSQNNNMSTNDISPKEELLFQVTPTLLKDSFTIINPKGDVFNYQVYDSSGRILISSNSLKEKTTIIDVNNLKGGHYIVHIESQNKTKTVRVLKKK